MTIIETIFSNTLIAFLILISIVVVFHELGHFLVGRLFGIDVDEFSVGFGPKIFSFKIGRTEYRFNWLLLGGYVRFYGGEAENLMTPEKREKSILHAKLYKRMCVSVAGPLANFVLSFVIMTCLFAIGMAKQPAVFRVLNDSVAYQDGLRSGDRVVKIDGQKVSDWSGLMQKVATSPNIPLKMDVERNHVMQTIVVTPKAEVVAELEGTSQKVGRLGITPFFSEPMIAPLQGQFFSEIGLKRDDKIISVNGIKVKYLNDFLMQVEQATVSTSDYTLAQKILANEAHPLVLVIDNQGVERTISVNFTSSALQNWARRTVATRSALAWTSTVAPAELTIATAENLNSCHLNANDTLRRIDDSNFFTSQVDVYSWLENETIKINQNVTKFKNNSIPVNMMVTNENGVATVQSCFLSIRHDRNPSGAAKLSIDFPIKFAFNPALYPTIRIQGKNLWEDVSLGFQSMLSQMTFIYIGLKKLFSGNVPLSSLGGPIAIAGFAGDAAKAGFETFLLAMSLMSVNIGIFNLLPFPALDGGVFLLQIVELINRKPLSQKTQSLIARIGIAFLLTLFLFVFYNDIMRLFYRQ